MEKRHPLRATIEDILEKVLTTLDDKSIELVKVGNENSNVKIPLYFVDEAGRSASYCNVDALILKDDRIRIIFEVEEGEIDAVRVCGNYLASAFSQFHIHKEKNGGRRIMMGSNVTFLQIISAPITKNGKTSKADQLENIETSIRSKPIKDSYIKDYYLLVGTPDDFRNNSSEFTSIVTKALIDIKSGQNAS